ncbi:MAG: TraB/GumN family protein [Treponema sp.]|jgi:pheromone shutdown-related protein TraB|nr:TraB/GumN family protein [Treponema sp.]
MNSSSVRITLTGRDIHLIGTAHVSRESIDEVAQVIREERPDVVCVELDEGRYSSITQKESWERLDVSKVFKEGKGFLLIANLVLASFQRRLGNDLGVKPGEEMKTAIETAGELGIPYSLCDREVQITLRRAWARCSLWGKCKLLAALFSSAFTTEKLSSEEIENLKDRNELDGMMTELANYLPGVKETLIDERDHYLAAKIWAAADQTNQQPANAAGCRAVAVVGAGHIPGIQSWLEKFAANEKSCDVEALDIIPPPGFLSRGAKWIIPVAIIALIAVGFFRSGADLSLAMMSRWILWNGSLAALGCLLALGHPLAIVVSFLGAPFTTLIPFIGVGILSGLVQASFHKPRVSDAQTISEDVATLKGVYRNRISRALLVFFLSSLGSSIGTFVSIPAIAGLLVK